MPNQPIRLGIAGGLGGALVDAAEQYEVSRDYHEEKHRRRKREDVEDKYRKAVIEDFLARRDADDSSEATDFLSLADPLYNVAAQTSEYASSGEIIDLNNNGIDDGEEEGQEAQPASEADATLAQDGMVPGAGGYFYEDMEDRRKGGPMMSPAPGALGSLPATKDANATRRMSVPQGRLPVDAPAKGKPATTGKQQMTDLEKKQDAAAVSLGLVGSQRELDSMRKNFENDYNGFQRQAERSVMEIAAKHSNGKAIPDFATARQIILATPAAQRDLAARNRRLREDPRFVALSARQARLDEMGRTIELKAITDRAMEAFISGDNNAIGQMIGVDPKLIKRSSDPAMPGWEIGGNKFGQTLMMGTILAKAGLLPYKDLLDLAKVEQEQWAKITGERDRNNKELRAAYARSGGQGDKDWRIQILRRRNEVHGAILAIEGSIASMRGSLDKMKPGDPKREAVERQIADLEQMRAISLGEMDMIGTMTPGSAANEKVDLERDKHTRKLSVEELDRAKMDGVYFLPNIKHDSKTGNLAMDTKNGVSIPDPETMVNRYAYYQRVHGKPYADAFMESVRGKLDTIDNQVPLIWNGMRGDKRRWWAGVDQLARQRYGGGAAQSGIVISK